MDFILGAIPSPDDPRDYKVSNIISMAANLPEEFLIDYPGEIKNQGSIGSCVAHSLAYTREITEAKQSGEFKAFSVGFIYGNRVGTIGELIGGEGMAPRDALKNLQVYGDVLFDEFPINDTYPVVSKSIEEDKDVLYEESKPFKITSYCRIYTVDEVKNALIQLGAVTICCPIYPSFYTVNRDNALVPFPETDVEKLIGYHQMTIIGWRKDNKWVVLNSWGKEWGDNGKCYLPFNYPVEEYWSITDAVTGSMDNFVDLIKNGAVKAFYKHHVFASLTIAQAILESGWGSNAPGYNLFGIKWFEGCGYDYQLLHTWEYENGKWIKVEDKFKKYSSFEESIEDHTQLFLRTHLEDGSLRYQRVLDAKNYKEACTAVRECGYATDPYYSQKLINIIEKCNLNQYDMTLSEAISILQNKGKIKSPEYWLQNAIPGGTVRGDFAAALIREVSKSFLSSIKSVFMSLDSAVKALQDNSIIKSPDYWLQNAIPGKTIIGEYAGRLIINMAFKLNR